MCGFAAIYDRTGGGIDRDALMRMSDRLAPRGPDGAGLWLSDDDRIGFAHRRLAIIDLSESGAEPMLGGGGRHVIVFNGEIYNYKELRAELEKEGATFRTESDTEVILQLYDRVGENLVHRLAGMFAFVIWDTERKSLFAARDPYGIKPLYFADDGRTVRFASTVKALVAGGSVDTSPNPAGHVGLFLWGTVPEPHTLFKGIRAIPAGHRLRLDGDARCEPESYASIGRAIANAEQEPHPGGADALAEALRESVRRHLVADVPVGVFLSAGLDSTTLAAHAAEAGGRLRTVTLGFSRYRGTPSDEVPLAEAVARQLGAEHTTVWIEASDFETEREKLFDAMDQPTLDGINSYFVSRAAIQAGLKVAISGVGGDELFGGYPSFRIIPRLVAGVGAIPRAPAIGKGLRMVTSPILSRFTSPKYAGLMEYGGDYAGAYILRRGLFMPWELPGVLDPDLARAGWQELAPQAVLSATVSGISAPALRVSALESCHYMRNQLLRDTDWASMAHGLEVRTPLVDWRLLGTVARLRAANPDLGKKAMAKTPVRPLPDALLDRPKTGFTVPIRAWPQANGRQSPAKERGHRGWLRYVYGRFTGAHSDAE